MLVEAFGPPESMVMGELATPTPGAGQVRIAVEAAGVNFADLLMIAGKYQHKPALPFAAGIEVAGTVSAVGPGVEDVAAGERVMALCLTGGFAEQVCVDRKFVFALSDAVSFEHAAVFPVAYGTAWHALADRGRLTANEWLLVFGAGSGVGLAAVELGVLMGARVIAVASSAEKLRAASERGAHFTIDHTRGSLREQVRECTGGSGFDVCFDPVGGALFDEALHCVGPEGRILVVGFASGRVPSPPANLLLVKGCAVVGVHTSAAIARAPALFRDRFETLQRWASAGLLRPLTTRTFELAEVPRALRAVADGKMTGRAVVRVGTPDELHR
jgi:NADPH2:quinone reductase